MLNNINGAAHLPILGGLDMESVVLSDNAKHPGVTAWPRIAVAGKDAVGSATESYYDLDLAWPDGTRTDYMTDRDTGWVVRYDYGLPADSDRPAEADSEPIYGAEGHETVEDDLTEAREQEVFERNRDAFFDYINNEHANQKLEQSMGLNMQPVSLDEIESLRKLISSLHSE